MSLCSPIEVSDKCSRERNKSNWGEEQQKDRWRWRGWGRKGRRWRAEKEKPRSRRGVREKQTFCWCCLFLFVLDFFHIWSINKNDCYYSFYFSPASGEITSSDSRGALSVDITRLIRTFRSLEGQVERRWWLHVSVGKNVSPFLPEQKFRGTDCFLLN